MNENSISAQASDEPMRTEFERQHNGRNLTRHRLRRTYSSAPIAALWNQHKRTAEWCAAWAATMSCPAPVVFAIDGSQAVDAAHLDCPTCGGSGHIDDCAAAGDAGADWQECQRISDLPEVHNHLKGFAEDPTGDNGVCVVRAILSAVAFTRR